MRDPVRHKNRALLHLYVKFQDEEKTTTLYEYIDKEKAKNIPAKELEKRAKSKMELLSRKPGTKVNELGVVFEYTKGSLSEFDFGDVLIQANLPYCLHIPDHHEFKISIPEKNIKALISLEKIWTKRARAEDKNSDNLDIFAEDKPLYFKKSTILGPQVPVQPEEGWQPYITGVNLEKKKDKNGIFRYSRTNIQLKMDIPSNLKNIEEDAKKQLFSEIREKATDVINIFIDNYREICNEAHVRRLGEITINLIYFIPPNIGYYLLLLNTETAMINRSKQDIDKLTDNLTNRKKPALYKLLLLNAKDSLNSKDYTLAIVESFQALEIFLENFLISEYTKRGDDEESYRKELDKNWRTKKRLNKLLKDLKGSSMNEQTEIWDAWCLKYDKTRNEVIHSGKEPTLTETKETLAINQKVIKYISSL